MGKNGNREYLEKRSLKNTVFKGTGGAEKTEETEKRIINTESIEYFKRVLIRNEKSIQTIEKYIRDIKKLMIYAHGQSISKEMLLEYKEYLGYDPETNGRVRRQQHNRQSFPSLPREPGGYSHLYR